MKTILIILLTLITLDFYSQEKVDWRNVEVFQMTSAEYPFDKKYNNDTLYAVGEKFIKINLHPKNLTDLSVGQLNKLKKSFAKQGVIVVYVDLNGFFDKERLEIEKEYYIIYIVRQKK